MDFKLTELQARRDAAIERGVRWTCSAHELLAAYAAGERDFSDADLSCANLSDADLYCADLRGADLSDANLYRANLRDANLYRANLRDADLSDADLSGANLSDADLSGADLYCADLRGANLSRADLYCADLRGADLSRTDFPAGFHILQIAPVGSRRAELQARVDVDGTQTVITGCFRGTLAEFEAAVARKAEDDPYRVEYETLVIPAIRAFFALHTVKQGA